MAFTFYGMASNGKEIEVFRITKQGPAHRSVRHETVTAFPLNRKGERAAMEETRKRNCPAA